MSVREFPSPAGTLPAAKQRLMERRLKSALQSNSDQPAITHSTATGPAPLSFAQQRLWFLDQLHPASPLYNMTMAARLEGTLDVSALHQAISVIIIRHQVLHTRFINLEGEPWQEVFELTAVSLPVVDLSTQRSAPRDAELQRRLQVEAQRPFSLAGDVLCRAVLFRLGSGEHVLFLNMHHIASDALSFGVFFKELGHCYEAFLDGRPPGLPELTIQYADYAAWQNRELHREAMRAHLQYWREQLAGAPELLELPANRSRPTTPSGRGGRQVRHLPIELAGQLQKLSQREGVTLFMLLLTAFKTFLHRFTGREDLLVGIPAAGRHQLETEQLIGFFINTLVLRNSLCGAPSFRELVQRVRATTLKAYAHQELPFEKLVEELRPERTTSYIPLIQVMFVWQTGSPDALSLPGLQVALQEVGTGTAKFDLTLTMGQSDQGLTAEMEFNSDLFDAETINSWLANFEVLLTGISRNPDARLHELPLLTEAERHRLLVEWNHTQKKYPRDASVTELFEARAAQCAESVAIVYGEQQLTYRELNQRANRLAHYLERFELRPEQCVGVCLERSPAMIIALLAVLKIGAAYLPLDRSYPLDRLKFMLADARAPLLITGEEFAAGLAAPGVQLLCLETAALAVAEESSQNLLYTSKGQNLAYVIYTSGSTGKPKGVCTPHRAITRTIFNTDYVRFGVADVIAQATSCSFDAAIWEVWGALLNGARLEIIPTSVLLSIPDLENHLQRQGITSLFLTTSLFHQLASEAPRIFRGLRYLMVGGEAMELKWAREVLREGPPAHLLNGYGPTEATTFATYKLVNHLSAEAHTVPIGRPIANTTVYVLDAHLQPVPPGVPGELYIGGDGVARGYLNRPELTAERFLHDPFGGDTDSRLYKTGDLARHLPDGDIEFLGRMDQQVKVRGFRVEPGEIESVLLRHPGVLQCSISALADAAGAKQLVAHVVPRDGFQADTPAWQNFLKQELPEYMVPAFFVTLQEFPLTPNGKVDQRSLPAPELIPSAAGEPAGPRDDIERQLQSLWESVLKVHPIGMRDKFFALGGHSLLAVKLLARVEKVFGQNVPVAALFRHPTIEQMAALLRNDSSPVPSTGSSIIEIQPRGSRPPLLLVHGVGGGMFWGYNNLAHHLGADQPVFAFRSRGLEGEQELEDIGSMAETYLADLRAFQPRGPYFLGGYCFGGVVAYEMARRLEARGETVALLALINATPPNSSYTCFHWTPAIACKFVRNFCVRSAVSLCSSPEKRSGFLRWKARFLKKRLQQWLWHSPVQTPAETVTELLDLSQYSDHQRKLWQTHVQSLMNYQPQAYSGPVTLFRSPAHLLFCSFDPEYGWGELARGGVSVKVIPGAHETIMEEPYVQRLAAELNACLAIVRSSGTP